ncbi:MAG TPA: hypothetical protein VGR81_03705 [Candidatus Acidoferrales bacterium]|nr:hypothetical protein [Candidatus Acidoferrales bacterium]
MRGGRLGPLAAFIEAGESADGAENREGRGRLNETDLFEDFFDDRAEVFAAADIESSGASVTVDDGLAAQTVGFLNPGGSVPVQEIVLDGLAIRMIADLAFAAVASIAFMARDAAGMGFGFAWFARGRSSGGFGERRTVLGEKIVYFGGKDRGVAFVGGLRRHWGFSFEF